ncbi:glycoside hydrolase superfamily [Polychytrium aggregatum]|uniref:glycoside hydrolase superfamily n=1 Tax=Polychytrium aggregatum TaxID=110093 RepID=UPI0022FEA031|nr:glycoside hydrolase superfamily [Polychytrium aggregatum]KAI9206607.1 glycoside hydrolase superfamily [Polychytrium aggregatum]
MLLRSVAAGAALLSLVSATTPASAASASVQATQRPRPTTPLSYYLWPQPSSIVDAQKVVDVSDSWLDFSSPNTQLETVIQSAYDRFAHSLEVKRANIEWSGSTFRVQVVISDHSTKGPASLVGIDESYKVQVTQSLATVTAKTQAGAVYGLQTLSQMITKDGYLRLGTITDAPRFSYRGLMLDTARNFFPVEDIKRILDGLVYSKVNVLHWHIYDSQSFPIKWDRYPQMLDATYKYDDGTPKLYTQQDVADIVDYAFQRNIRVIPEFEAADHNAVFGHINASYIVGWNHSPWDGRNGQYMNSTDQPDPANPTAALWWGGQYCNQFPCGQLDIRNPDAIAVLDHLISDIGSWFPDPVLHVGHDEVNARVYGLVPDSWDVAPSDLMYPLFAKFEPHLLQTLSKAKKQYAAWDEVIDTFNIQGILPKNALITQWQQGANNDADRVNAIAAAGFSNIVVSPSDYWYLDCSPSQNWCSTAYEQTVPAFQYNLTGYLTYPGQWHNWTYMYSYDPLWGLTPNASQAVKGGFGAMWSETLKRHNVDHYIFPRISAIAERLWSYNNTQWNDQTTPLRLERFRESLINELNIDAAALDYLGNQEGTTFKTEACDGAGLHAPGQKTSSCTDPGCPVLDSKGNPVVPPSYFAALGDYCDIAATYKTNSFAHTNPSPVPYSL